MKRPTENALMRLYRHIRATLTLRNKSVTIISNDCWGARKYKQFHLPFNSPFIGVVALGPEYITLLENPELITAPLRFISREESRYRDYLEATDAPDTPIALLGERVELHFWHVKSEEEARRKWEKRVGRIDPDNCIVKFSDRDICDEALLRRFDRLPYPCKVAFTPKHLPDCQSVVTLPEFAGHDHVSHCWKVSERHWDFVSHANALLHR